MFFRDDPGVSGHVDVEKEPEPVYNLWLEQLYLEEV